MMNEACASTEFERSLGQPGLRYRFADLTLDVGQRRVSRARIPIPLGRLTYEMLQVLVAAAPNVVTQEELARSVWKGRLVSTETVTQRIKLLRDALSDRAQSPRYIGLVRGHGYRLLGDVETLSAADDDPTLGHLAVLPFENLSSELQNQFFAEGLHEELLTELASLDELRVVSRTSVKQYGGSQRPIQEIAAALGVGRVMEGSIRYAGDRIRVTAQLIDGVSGAHIWAQVFDQKLDDVFEAQSELAKKISSRFRDPDTNSSIPELMIASVKQRIDHLFELLPVSPS